MLDSFLTEFPNGRHHAEARERRDELTWAANELDRQIEAAWLSASDTHTIESYETFLQEYPRSQHSPDMPYQKKEQHPADQVLFQT